MQEELEALRALSDHPRTCLTLRAGGMAGIRGEGHERVGSYAWANFGFDFADAHGIEPAIDDYGARAWDDDGQLPTLALMQRHFEAWLEEMVRVGALQVPPALLARLKEASRTWKHPWEVASFHIKGLTIETKIGNKSVSCGLGKAFLVSSDSINWDGVFFVNEKKSVGRGIQERYCKRTVEVAERLEHAQQTAWRRALKSRERDQVLAAIKEIGRKGGPDWVPSLVACRNADPTLVKEISVALQQVEGEALLEGQYFSMRCNFMPPEARAIALSRASEMTGTFDPREIRALLSARGADSPLALRREVLKELLHRTEDGEGALRAVLERESSAELLRDVLDALSCLRSTAKTDALMRLVKKRLRVCERAPQ